MISKDCPDAHVDISPCSEPAKAGAPKSCDATKEVFNGSLFSELRDRLYKSMLRQASAPSILNTTAQDLRNATKRRKRILH